jgi:acetyl/propionyl-CoA carboxylase alpha subunit
MIGALERFVLLGIRTNIGFLIELLRTELFARGAFTTSTLDRRAASASPSEREAAAAADHPRTVAAVAAAALLGPSAARAANDDARTAALARPGPWERLGPWRSGGR